MDSSLPKPAANPPTAGPGLLGASVHGHEVAARVVPVAVGQLLQATVVAVQDGLAWLGHRGALFAARVDAALVPGQSYDFAVVRTAPVVELALQSRPFSAPAAPWPGLESDSLRALIQAVARPAPDEAGAAGGSRPFAPAAAALARGEITGDGLRDFVRGLGHDLEAQVFRMSRLDAASASAAAVELRATAKAEALAALVLVEPDLRATRPEAALVAQLGAAERENAVRAELGLPTWLPLPSCPAVGLEEARWFVAKDGGGGSEQDAAEVPLTIVLLLDFTRLLAVRVDIALFDSEVDVAIKARDPATALLLLEQAESLRAELTRGGLSVRSVRVASSPVPQLPHKDLVVPPCDGSAMVDCRA